MKEMVNAVNVSSVLDYEVLVEKVNKYYNRVVGDYKFYKDLYLESINKDRMNIKHESTYKCLARQVENIEYYFHDILVKSSDNVETEEQIEELEF